ncbi:low molecular weight protein-tyrosine-phosphatase [Paenibacillus sp. HJGM_3]|uniref:low molecular weight protein-tyrosine-phosphatase n=1 Tax=Paenibacillus sp. HJGM_3 TaxID=3379816 RepID=UPI00385E9C02
MIHVLFVCLGNICRSPMAEAVLRHQVKEAGLDDRIVVDSAGTGDWHVGQAPHQGTQRQLNKVKIEHKDIRARQVARDDWVAFDYIIAMDAQNRKDMLRLMGQPSNAESADDSRKKVYLFMDFVPNARVKDVPDPYYTGNFEHVYELIEEGCRNLLSHIRERLA